MGYARVGTGVAALFEKALNLGRKNGRFIKTDSRWTLTDEGNDFAKHLSNSMVSEEISSEQLKVASNRNIPDYTL